jgi:hypothetical protein
VVDKITGMSVNETLTVKEGQGLVEKKDFKTAARR